MHPEALQIRFSVGYMTHQNQDYRLKAPGCAVPQILTINSTHIYLNLPRS